MEKIIEKINYNTKIAKVTIHKVIDRKGVAAEIFGSLGQHGVNIELISTSSSGRNRSNISFATLESNLDALLKLLENIKDKFGAEKVVVDKGCALITLYGSQLSTTPGTAGKVFATLSERGINIEMISASLTVLSVIVSKDKVEEAVEAIKGKFAT